MSVATSGKGVGKGRDGERGKAVEHEDIPSSGGNHQWLISSAPFQRLPGRKDPDSLLVYPLLVLSVNANWSFPPPWPGRDTVLCSGTRCMLQQGWSSSERAVSQRQCSKHSSWLSSPAAQGQEFLHCRGHEEESEVTCCPLTSAAAVVILCSQCMMGQL